MNAGMMDPVSRPFPFPPRDRIQLREEKKKKSPTTHRDDHKVIGNVRRDFPHLSSGPHQTRSQPPPSPCPVLCVSDTSRSKVSWGPAPPTPSPSALSAVLLESLLQCHPQSPVCPPPHLSCRDHLLFLAPPLLFSAAVSQSVTCVP